VAWLKQAVWKGICTGAGKGLQVVAAARNPPHRDTVDEGVTTNGIAAYRKSHGTSGLRRDGVVAIPIDSPGHGAMAGEGFGGPSGIVVVGLGEAGIVALMPFPGAFEVDGLGWESD
jgi:hypothetical protein